MNTRPSPPFAGRAQQSVDAAICTFLNPILPTPSQDPWVIFQKGLYYAVNTDGRVIVVRKSPTVHALYQQEPVIVWTVPRGGPYSRHVWAPELHFLDGKWVIFFAADDGKDRNHRIWVLHGETEDATGSYRLRGTWATGGWAIDATVFHGEDGQLYGVWSGWPGNLPGQQNLYIAPMSDSLTISGPRVLLTEPGEPWERRGMPICEGPAMLRQNGVTCLVYSASGSWTADYCLGMLVNRDGDYLNAASWTKKGPVFQRTEDVWGVGHCSFVTTEDCGNVLFYHAKTRRQNGWKDRNIRAQTFSWGPDGLPDFGSPSPVGASLHMGRKLAASALGGALEASTDVPAPAAARE